jgi:hypothetical protein
MNGAKSDAAVNRAQHRRARGGVAGLEADFTTRSAVRDAQKVGTADTLDASIGEGPAATVPGDERPRLRRLVLRGDETRNELVGGLGRAARDGAAGRRRCGARSGNGEARKQRENTSFHNWNSKPAVNLWEEGTS